MKILHVSQGLEQTSGISAFLVENANRQANAGHEVALLYERILEYRPSKFVRVYKRKTPFGIDLRPDVVHIHGVWSLFSAYAMLWCIIKHIPFIVSPHGCLMPRVFLRGMLKKKLFYHLLIAPLMKKAAIVHVTASHESEAVRALGFCRQLEIIPLGVAGAVMPKVGKGQNLHLMLFVGRISEEKGLVNLLRAWRQTKHEGWRLMLAGPDWKGYRDVLNEEVARLELLDEVLFPGTVVGDAKDELYSHADCFVLPSPMENFSAVVLEALAHGLPVIATKGTPWREIEECSCGWWIDQGLEPLVEALQAAVDKTDEGRREMGKRGVALAQSRYSWDLISRQTLVMYERVVDAGNKENG